jgi:uncharacterized protein (TIGR02646 family)
VIHIDKGPEPRELVQHRASSRDATYGDFRGVDALRTALVKEQGHLCAYCMQRITAAPGGMKIEHWYPQSPPAFDAAARRLPPAPRGPLDFGNLLGVCTGGEHRPRAEQHCDTRKGNRLLTIDPLDRPERLLRYRTDGSVHATDPSVQPELDDILNLNLDGLKHNRKGAWDGAYAALKRGGERSFRPAALLRQLDRVRQLDHHGKRVEYCGYVGFFLDKKLQRVRASGSPP